MKPTHDRIPSLDGLRTISIALVIASHVAHGIGFREFGNLGDLGVRIFFVISGFLITKLLISEMDRSSTVDLWRFYFRRTLRIFPPYYFFLAVFAILVLIGRLNIDLRHLIPALAYVSDYVWPHEWLVDHAWSLSVEEQFYLVYPGLLLLFGRRGIERVLGATLILCPILRFAEYPLFHSLGPIWLIKGFHANLDTLAIGCLLAYKYDALHRSTIYLRILRSRAMYLLPVAIVLINSQIDYTGLDLGLLYSVNNVLIALFLDWAVTNYQSPAGALLNSRVFVVLGMMSYSMYIWQQPFLDPFPQSRAFQFPFNIAGFVFCTCFSYFLVERLSLWVRKRYEDKIFTGGTGNLIAPAEA